LLASLIRIHSNCENIPPSIFNVETRFWMCDARIKLAMEKVNLRVNWQEKAYLSWTRSTEILERVIIEQILKKISKLSAGAMRNNLRKTIKWSLKKFREVIVGLSVEKQPPDRPLWDPAVIWWIGKRVFVTGFNQLRVFKPGVECRPLWKKR